MKRLSLFGAALLAMTFASVGFAVDPAVVAAGAALKQSQAQLATAQSNLARATAASTAAEAKLSNTKAQITRLAAQYPAVATYLKYSDFVDNLTSRTVNVRAQQLNLTAAIKALGLPANTSSEDVVTALNTQLKAIETDPASSSSISQLKILQHVQDTWTTNATTASLAQRDAQDAVSEATQTVNDNVKSLTQAQVDALPPDGQATYKAVTAILAKLAPIPSTFNENGMGSQFADYVKALQGVQSQLLNGQLSPAEANTTAQTALNTLQADPVVQKYVTGYATSGGIRAQAVYVGVQSLMSSVVTLATGTPTQYAAQQAYNALAPQLEALNAVKLPANSSAGVTAFGQARDALNTLIDGGALSAGNAAQATDAITQLTQLGTNFAANRNGAVVDAFKSALSWINWVAKNYPTNAAQDAQLAQDVQGLNRTIQALQPGEQPPAYTPGDQPPPYSEKPIMGGGTHAGPGTDNGGGTVPVNPPDPTPSPEPQPHGSGVRPPVVDPDQPGDEPPAGGDDE